jgi:hypothetical protein
MLEHFFGSKTRLKLLKVFFRSPERAFYVRELARLINTQLHAVRREIANLEKMKIIKKTTAHDIGEDSDVGTERSKYFQLDTESPLFVELSALLTKAELLEEKELVDEIKDKGGKIGLFMLTGIFTGEKEASTDMVVVGNLKPMVLSKIIRRYESDLGKTIRYTFMSTQEFNDRRHIGDRFLFSLLEAKHIFVVNEFQIS